MSCGRKIDIFFQNRDIENFLGLEAETIDGQHKIKDAKLTGYALISLKAAIIFHFNFNTYGINFYWFEQV